MENSSYDITIIGSGIACSMTLCQLADRLAQTRGGAKTLRIAVIEREGEFWSGVPYGRRSIIGALAFQKLQDFLEESERTAYINWLVGNKQRWIRTFLDAAGLSAARWISDNQAFMEHGQWGELYLPRFLFGIYVSERAARAIDRLSHQDLASVTPLHGEANGVVSEQDGSYTVTVEDARGTETQVHSRIVVLAIGSPPQKSIKTSLPVKGHRHTYISDIYVPSEDVSIKRIYEALKAIPEKRMANVLVVGSNASSLEVLYLINYRAEIRSLINSVVVISRTGSLPYKICEAAVDFELSCLEALNRSSAPSADELIAAITKDVRRAQQSAVNVADLQHAISAFVGRLLARMEVAEQEKFTLQHGSAFSRLLRRAGRDTRNAADELANSGLLTLVKGDFRRLDESPSGEAFVSAVYGDVDRGRELADPTPFSIVVNCGGFEELHFCSSRLINNLIDNGLCKVNSTNRGFLVNENLEANDNLFVIGPLVGGNFNDKVRFWHVESALRIAGLSKLLADSLCASLFSPKACLHFASSHREQVLHGKDVVRSFER
jgi:uncharacterized NAD(P)/FAD-binding protein YdhS